nr:hypothetical protein [Tanacetum cinerariifolium]
MSLATTHPSPSLSRAATQPAHHYTNQHHPLPPLFTADTIITSLASYRRNTTTTLAAALPPPSPPTTIPSPQPRAATLTSVSPPSQPPRHPAATTITTIMGCLFDGVVRLLFTVARGCLVGGFSSNKGCLFR